MKKALLLSTSLLILSSCHFGPVLDNPAPSGSVSPSASASIIPSTLGSPTENFPTVTTSPSSNLKLSFKPITREHMYLIPTTSSTSDKTTGDIFSLQPDSKSNFEEWIPVSVTEAYMEGMTGTYKDVMEQKINPVINSWADDARLTYSIGYPSDTGVNAKIQIPASITRPGGWHFVYASSKMHETLTINVSDKETIIIKQKWDLSNIKTSTLKIDSNAAITKVIESIKNPKFMPEDSSSYLYPCAVQILYEIPANLVWDIMLYEDTQDNKNYWRVHFAVSSTTVPQVYTSASPIPTPAVFPDTYTDGSALVDAETGEILSLKRIGKTNGSLLPNPIPSGWTCSASPAS